MLPFLASGVGRTGVLYDALMAAKVGLVDDPIWSQPASVEVRRDPGAVQKRHRRWLVAVVAAIVVLVGTVTVLIARSGHPGGDPDGVVLAQIRSAVAEAIPAGSTLAGSQFADSQFQGCGYGSAKSGWSQPTGGTAFRTNLADAAVVSYASANLARHGWKESPGSSSIWTKSLGGDQRPGSTW